ncbi:MAG: hypothetical protein QW566_09755, partial [Candidatus Jordarchaeales archaeon]
DNSIDNTAAQCIIRFLRGGDLSSDSTCSSNDYVKRNMKIKISDIPIMEVFESDLMSNILYNY